MYIIILLVISIFFIFIWKLSNVYKRVHVTKTISVIILNYNRPHNLKKSLPILEKFKNIGEIVVLHGNANTFSEHNTFSKVKDVQDFEHLFKVFNFSTFTCLKTICIHLYIYIYVCIQICIYIYTYV